MNNNQINTELYPEFLKLGDDYNNPIIFVKQMERMEQTLNRIQVLIKFQTRALGITCGIIIFRVLQGGF